VSSFESRLLSGPELLSWVISAAKTSKRAWFASGFLKSGLLDKLQINPSSDLRVCSRWRLADLASGASDVDAGAEVLARGGRFFLHPRLHAKVFLFDDIAFIGSANLTHSGIPIEEHTGNLEAVVCISASNEISAFLAGIFSQGIEVDDEFISAVLLEVTELPQRTELSPEFSTAMPQAFETHVSKRGGPLTGADFPWCPNPVLIIKNDVDWAEQIRHDIEHFSLSQHPTIEEVSAAYRSSRSFMWLLEATKREIRFGELSASLHDSLHGDPRPYRSEVKQLLRNSIVWTQAFAPERLIEFRHKHTSSYRSSNLQEQNS